MRKICLFNTTINSTNIGNNIIEDTCIDILRDYLKNDFIINIPYLDKISEYTLENIKDADFTVFLGTNALSAEMNKYRQWGLTKDNSKYISNVVLMGVGWWQYQNQAVNDYTKNILRNVLKKDCIHSVRDAYTEKRLKSIGINNVLNTGCPTIWKLNEEHCSYIPKEKAKNVICTLTDYNKKNSIDLELLNVLNEKYEKIYFWIQGLNDKAYLEELLSQDKRISEKIVMIPPSLKQLDDVLESNEGIDYIGTRLHAGIRALQKKRRTIIMGIDNRGIEMGRDFGLPVIERQMVNVLRDKIESSFETNIILPEENIKKYMKQFQCMRRDKIDVQYNLFTQAKKHIKRYLY